MQKSSYIYARATGFLRRNQRAVACLLLLLGAVLRLAWLGRYPAGLNQDEASIGYDAFSLAHYGVDRNGNSWPVLLVAWGSGQNALYAYLLLPFVRLLGLSEFSIRLPSALLGIAALAVFYYVCRKLRGPLFGLLGLAVLAVNPWHVMLSRWALESNILPFFLLVAIACLLASFTKPYWLCGTGAALGLSLYAYGTAFVLLPPFIVVCFLWLALLKQAKLKPVAAAAGVFAAIAWPITLCNLRNMLGLGSLQIGPFTLPALTETRQASVMDFSATSIKQHAKMLLRLMVYQNDGEIHNTLGNYSLMMPLGMLLAAVGLVYMLWQLWRRRVHAGEMVWLLWLGCGFLASLLIDINVNRVNFLFLPLIYANTVGLAALIKLPAWLLRKAGGIRQAALQTASAVLAAVLLWGGTIGFVATYSGTYQAQIASAWNHGFGDAIRYAAQQRTANETVVVTALPNMPYISVLFYTQTPTPEFLGTVVYSDESASFRWVATFSQYRFGFNGTAEENTLYILHSSEREAALAAGIEILAEFDTMFVGRG